MEHIDDIPRRGALTGRRNWIGQDAWYYREVGDGTYLMVSRRRLEIERSLRKVYGAWDYGWRWHRHWIDGPLGTISHGPGPTENPIDANRKWNPATYGTALEAITAADKHAAESWKT